MTMYEACRDLIRDGAYEYHDMKKKMDMFLRFKKLTQAEYDELLGAMTAPPVAEEK